MTAFYDALPKIKEREILMGFEPSEPQLVIGEAMQLALPELQRRYFIIRTIQISAFLMD